MSVVTKEMIQTIEDAPVGERLRLAELILRSLRTGSAPLAGKQKIPSRKFRVRSFSLGKNVSVDRDALYRERTK